jgi:hypothetical protein
MAPLNGWTVAYSRRTKGLALACVGTLISLLVAAPFSAAEPVPSAAERAPSSDTDRWPYDLPFLADEALKRGYELPLPRGLSALYYYVQRDIEISDVRLGINGSPLRNVSHFVNLGSKSHVNVAVGRFDAWLLPVVDVYGLLGSVWNNTTTKGTVTVPTQGLRPSSESFNVSAKTDLNGFVGGVGLTAAAGYQSIFLLGDVNYSQTDIGFDDKFKALIGSIRAGWNGKFLDTPTRLWVGGMYWDTKSTAKATVNVPNVGAVSFEAEQGPVHPLNAIVGGSVTLFRHWDALLECGFNGMDVQTIATGLTFRF